MEQIDSKAFAQKTGAAQDKIEEGQNELDAVRKYESENRDVLAHEASMGYTSKLLADLETATRELDVEKAGEISASLLRHIETMKEYAALARENVGDYIDSSGEVDMEKFKEQMDAFVMETLVGWYGKDVAEKANPRMSLTPLSEIDHDALLENDPTKFGKYGMNPNRDGTEYIEKKEIPKVKILDMEEFVGKKTLSEVRQAVIEQYGATHRIPDMEDEQYILSLPPEQVPEEMKDDNWYYFFGSDFRTRDGGAFSPCARWNGSQLHRSARGLDAHWNFNVRVVLLPK